MYNLNNNLNNFPFLIPKNIQNHMINNYVDDYLYLIDYMFYKIYNIVLIFYDFYQGNIYLIV